MCIDAYNLKVMSIDGYCLHDSFLDVSSVLKWYTNRGCGNGVIKFTCYHYKVGQVDHFITTHR